MFVHHDDVDDIDVPANPICLRIFRKRLSSKQHFDLSIIHRYVEHALTRYLSIVLLDNINY